MTFMITCSFITTEDFIECCHKVYFAVEDFTVATFIIANSVLYYLFDEKTLIEENRGVKAQYRAYPEVLSHSHGIEIQHDEAGIAALARLRCRETLRSASRRFSHSGKLCSAPSSSHMRTFN